MTLRALGAHTLEAGLSAYREHAKALAVRALAAVYPRLQRWLGDAQFAGMAWAFARHRPPRQGDMNRWGLDLDEFLAAQAGMDLEPPALARLEAQLHRTADAADDPAPDPALWQRLQQQDPTRLRLCLSPLLWLGSLPLSLLPALADEVPTVGAAVDGDVLVWRQGFRPCWAWIEPDQAALVRACRQAPNLAAALEAVLARFPALDLGVLLHRAWQQGWLLDAVAIDETL